MSSLVGVHLGVSSVGPEARPGTHLVTIDHQSDHRCHCMELGINYNLQLTLEGWGGGVVGLGVLRIECSL